MQDSVRNRDHQRGDTADPTPKARRGGESPNIEESSAISTHGFSNSNVATKSSQLSPGVSRFTEEIAFSRMGQNNESRVCLDLESGPLRVVLNYGADDRR